jgi:FkbM family methyltransferase
MPPPEESVLFYGQNGEDFLLWEYFGRRKQGFFIDVGAFDGIYMSNSFCFERQGWNGICIEPTPRYAELCRAHRPGSICLPVACVGNEGLEEVEFREEALGLVSGITAEPDDPGLRNTYRSFHTEFQGFNRIRVKAATLNSILEEQLPFGTVIDFISLDVEGTETDVLRGLDIERYRPRVFVIEANTGPELEDLKDYLCAGFGYLLARQHTWNYFFLHPDEDIYRMQNIRVNCRVEAQMHPRGPGFSIPARRLSQK